MKNSKLVNPDPNGHHALIELYGCSKSQINNVTYLQNVITSIVNTKKIEILDKKFEKFNPCGVTGIFLLAASHISIHTWPEISYCTLDVFTCSNQNTTNAVYTAIMDVIKHTSSNVTIIRRGYEYKIPPYTRELLVFSTGCTMTITITKEIIRLINKYQKIEVINTLEFGKCLLINDVMQLSESDHLIYDNALIKMISSKTKNVLILGGGDGFIAKRILNIHANIKKITIVDIDPDVIKICNDVFHKGILGKKVAFIFEDVIDYIKKINLLDYDYIISDLTDNPIGVSKINFTDFYKSIFSILSKKSKPGITVAIQAGTSKVHTGVDSYKIIQDFASKYGYNMKVETIYLPSFGEEAAFVFLKICER